jgi:ATP:cob(I)alamin adenosyltransferase
MSISTKTGDKGQTSLYSGQRISKSALRVEAYGTLDELDAHLGEAKHFVQLTENKEIIETIQTTLVRVMAELATIDKAYPEAITLHEVEKITDLVRLLEKNHPVDALIIPGKTLPSAKLDICRTITRRAERKIVELADSETVSERILAYINRLSDLLFLMGMSETDK